MVYGSPDVNQPVRDFARVLDIAGHEMSHGLVQFTVNFIYYGEAGALNESVADCFGVTINQWHTQKEDWEIGKIFTDNPNQPLRAFNVPSNGYPPQPSHMTDFQVLPFNEDGDNGGVHMNSGIPNHAFYLVCQNLKEKSYEKPVMIWYRSLEPHPEWNLDIDADLGNIVRMTDLDGLSSIGRFTTFTQWAKRTVKVAGLLYGNDAALAVKKAWIEVGLLTN
jgi:Zn-dependent metalloprotease